MSKHLDQRIRNATSGNAEGRAGMSADFREGIHGRGLVRKPENTSWIQISSMDLACGAPHEAALRTELVRLKECHPLASSPKLRQLLLYLFHETLAGRGERISQYSIAFDCYGLGDRFDSATNTLVRSHARRLRRMLGELAPEEGIARILMRDRGYQLRLEVAGKSPPAGAPPDALRLPTLGILEFEDMTGTAIPHQLPGTLAAELMIEFAKPDGVEPAGPFSRAMLPAPHQPQWEFACSHGLDLLLDGAIFSEGGQCMIHPRIVDGKSGRQLWAMRHGIPADTSPAAIRAVARVLSAKVAGEWGVIPSHVAKLACSRADGPLRLHEAVMLARQYLTHFQFEHVGRCVRCLREAADDSGDAAVPATLAVLLNMVCSIEPRWHEPMNAREIHTLAARASRLDPDDPWTRLALAVSAMLDGRRMELLEMARRADREKETPWMLVGALGTIVCIQAMDVDLGRRMIRRYCEDNPRYPRLVHLTLAFLAFADGDLPLAREELARFGVPWGWSSPLLSAACFAVEGNADDARADWKRVITAFPDLPQRWRETIGTQWHESYLRRIFAALESVGVRTGCLEE